AEFQKYQASVSGGNEQTSFLLSGGFQKESTVFPGDFGFQSNNLLANINHRSEDNRLHLNSSFNYGYRKSNLFNAGVFVSNGVRLAPNSPALFDENGKVNWELDEYGNPTFINPLAGLNNPNTFRMSSLQWNGNFEYQIVAGLKAKFNLGLNNLNQDDEQIKYKKKFNPLITPIIRRTTHIRRETARKNIILEPQLHYSLKLENHQIHSLIGGTLQKNILHEND